MISCVGSPVMLFPSSRMRPERARGEPQIVFISVLLPAPFAPMSVTISPGLTVTLTSRSAWIAP
jgi:hypothetical protein